MVMSHQHNLRTVVVERLPEWAGAGAAPMVPGAKARVMHVGEGAGRGMGGEVAAQPLLLGRAGTHADVAVEHDDVPGPEVVAVVARGGVAGGTAEIVEVGRG